MDYDILKYSSEDARNRVLDRFEKEVKSAP
jgi:hypothetical protein